MKNDSSASQMTAAKVMDVIAKRPDCARQAAHAVSAYSQVKMKDAPKLLKIPAPGRPDIWIRLPRHKWPKSWSNIEDSVVLFERNVYRHPLAGLWWETQFEKVLFGTRMGKRCRIGNAHWFIENKDLCRYTWMASKWLEGSRISVPYGRNWMKHVDLDSPTSFFDHVYLGCTQREC